MTRCGDERPTTKEGAIKKQKQVFKLDDIGDMPISVSIFGGCIEGDRVTYSVRGNDRAVLAHGSVQDVIMYSIGQEVTLNNKEMDSNLQGTYKRNVDRKQEEAVGRIVDEMKGTGDIKNLTKGGNFNGYTVTINGEKVTPDSNVNSYFRKITFVRGAEQKPEPKAVEDLTDKDVRYFGEDTSRDHMGGVEIVVSAVIVPGSYTTNNEAVAYHG